MRQRLSMAVAVVASALAWNVAAAQTGESTATPVGRWYVMRPNGEPGAVVEIRAQGDELIGTARGSLVAGVPADARCTRCSGSRRDQLIVGLDILTGLRRDGDEWTGGEILDPDTGATYRANIRLEDGGATLLVRGYVGISWIGRTQRWRRAP